MDAKRKNSLEDTSNREIVITRVLNAPRERVIKAFGAIQGGNQTLDRLGEYLAQTARSSLAPNATTIVNP